MPRLIIVMGVSGCGKSTLGKALSSVLGCTFLEGDAFHPKANVAKMASGTPLTDSDRARWLDDILTWVNGLNDRDIVLACSALTPYVQNRLVTGAQHDILWLWLAGSKDLIAERLGQRGNHFMPPMLLSTQFDALSPPKAAIRIDISPAPEAVLETILTHMR